MTCINPNHTGVSSKSRLAQQDLLLFGTLMCFGCEIGFALLLIATFLVVVVAFDWVGVVKALIL